MGHHEWFVEQDLFKEGVPVDDTIARIISSIKPELFQACFIEWMQSVHQLTEGELVAIDGKTLRGSYNREDRNATIHMVSAYSSANKLVLGQIKTENKSNEITAIPELLTMLVLRGALAFSTSTNMPLLIAALFDKASSDSLRCFLCSLLLQPD